MDRRLRGARAKPLLNCNDPQRVAAIKKEHLRRVERARSKRQVNPLRPDDEPIDIDDLYGQAKVCLACHK